jgi:hypothetical protein
MRLPFVAAPQRKVGTPKINLYPEDPFFDTLIGRVMRWLVGAGRHLIIFTELIVITSFFSRFYLDRQITDLNTSLQQKQSVAQSYGNLENEFRQAQQAVADVEQVLNQQGRTEVFRILSTVTPPDVKYSAVSLSQGGVSLQGTVGSLQSMSQFVENLKATPDFQRINVSQLEMGDSKSGTLQFQVRFVYTKALQEFGKPS